MFKKTIPWSPESRRAAERRRRARQKAFKAGVLIMTGAAGVLTVVAVATLR